LYLPECTTNPVLVLRIPGDNSGYDDSKSEPAVRDVRKFEERQVISFGENRV